MILYNQMAYVQLENKNICKNQNFHFPPFIFNGTAHFLGDFFPQILSLPPSVLPLGWRLIIVILMTFNTNAIAK